MIDPLEDYFRDFDKISGWFVKSFVGVMRSIDRAQRARGVEGHVCEIGTYHGKSFIPLVSLLRGSEAAIAIDCYDDQSANLDGSGSGCRRSEFEGNLRRYVPDSCHRVNVWQIDSLQIRPEALSARMDGAQARMFSIDGGHTAEATEFDLGTAMHVLHRFGVIVLDDYFNPRWPGVSEGFLRFMINARPDLTPVFIGWNKVVCCRREFADELQAAIASDVPPVATTRFFARQVLFSR